MKKSDLGDLRVEIENDMSPEIKRLCRIRWELYTGNPEKESLLDLIEFLIDEHMEKGKT